MKRHFYLLTFTFLLATLGQLALAQTYNGNLTLTSQAQVDAFNYTMVTGSLTIDGNPDNAITNLNGLSELISVGGNLHIFGNTALASLTGLGALTSVGSINTFNNPALTSLTGLGALTSVGSLYIQSNSALTSFAGLGTITSLVEFVIYDNPSLTDITQLGALTSVLEYLSISDNITLTSLTGLGALTSVGEIFTIGGNTALTSLSALGALTSVGTEVSIYFNPVLTSLTGLDNIDPSTITSLVIGFNANLSTCEVEPICDYLAVPSNSAVIQDNATNCVSRAAVEAACLALPVELVSFSASSENNFTQLLWRTASETNNEGFEIQRSTDGKNWNELAFVPGYGNTQEEQSYTYTDERPLPGLNYYRLQQMDYDGKSEYSNIVSVEMKNGGSGIHFFPNPATGSVTLALETDYSGEATLTLYDLTGKQMKTATLSLEGGAFRTDIGLGSLPTGIYMAQVQAGGAQWRERLIIK